MNIDLDQATEESSGTLRSSLSAFAASKRRPGPKERSEIIRKRGRKRMMVVTDGTRQVCRAPRLDELDEDPQD